MPFMEKTWLVPRYAGAMSAEVIARGWAKRPPPELAGHQAHQQHGQGSRDSRDHPDGEEGIAEDRRHGADDQDAQRRVILPWVRLDDGLRGTGRETGRELTPRS